MAAKKTYVIDGQRFGNLEEFFDEISRAMLPDTEWGRNLDAIADILWGCFGPLDGSDFVIVWKDSELSRQRLGYPETIRYLEVRHDRARDEDSRKKLEAARDGEGCTLFELLVNYILEKKHIELIFE